MPETWDQAALEALAEIEGETPTYDPRDIDLTTEGWGTRADVLEVGRRCLFTLYRDGAYSHWRKTIHGLLIVKQHDYGHDNILAFGKLGLKVRMADKAARIRNLENRGAEGRAEPLIDAYIDIVGYCAIWLMLDAGTFTLPLKEDIQ